jgi:hypothetical protein
MLIVAPKNEQQKRQARRISPEFHPMHETPCFVKGGAETQQKLSKYSANTQQILSKYSTFCC